MCRASRMALAGVCLGSCVMLPWAAEKERHQLFVVVAVADFERQWLTPEWFEAEREVEVARRGVGGVDGQQQLLDARRGAGALNRRLHQHPPHATSPNLWG